MKNSRKTFYIANFILLFSVLVLSFVIAMVIMYNDQKNFATEKTDVLTEQVYNEVENVLDRLNTTSRAMFLDENFQLSAFLIVNDVVNLKANKYEYISEVISDIKDFDSEFEW